MSAEVVRRRRNPTSSDPTTATATAITEEALLEDDTRTSTVTGTSTSTSTGTVEEAVIPAAAPAAAVTTATKRSSSSSSNANVRVAAIVLLLLMTTSILFGNRDFVTTTTITTTTNPTSDAPDASSFKAKTANSKYNDLAPTISAAAKSEEAGDNSNNKYDNKDNKDSKEYKDVSAEIQNSVASINNTNASTRINMKPNKNNALAGEETRKDGSLDNNSNKNNSNSNSNSNDPLQTKKLLSYNTSELCATSLPAENLSSQFFECGRPRLLDEHGVAISIETFEVDSETGHGSITATMCHHNNCAGNNNNNNNNNNKFNASDVLLWVRFRSPGAAVFAVTAQAVDCHSWQADFRVPIEGYYHVDVMTLWLYGHPSSWRPESGRGNKRDIMWNGTLYNVNPNNLYGAYWRDGRYMSCQSWCLINKDCTHWTEHKMWGVLTKPGKCALFRNVTEFHVDQGAKSGHIPVDEKRIAYLGGLSLGEGDVQKKETCRELSHVLGAPTSISVPTAKDGRNSLERLSQLPWCSASDIGQTRDEEGFWARVSAVYPTAQETECPEPCVRDPSPKHSNDTTCTPSDTLQGACSFNDVTPIFQGWHTGALHTAEPPIRDLAWVERDCRYRIGNEALFKDCLKDKNINVINIIPNDIFADLLDRWRLGQVDKWNGRGWNDDFVYKDGEDWLFPNPSSDPETLRKHWNGRGHNTSIVPVTALVVKHLWGPILDQLYTKQLYDRGAFERFISKEIASWQSALKAGWLSKETVFAVILSPTVHEFFGDPHLTYEAMEYFNGIARPLYEQAGWKIVDGMAITRARPDYRAKMSWWNFQSDTGVKRSGCGVVYAMANVLFNAVCNA